MTELEDGKKNRAALDLLIRGFQVSRMIRLVADLGVADKIAENDRCDIRELAKACAVLPTPLLRVLRALAAFGIFRVTADGMVAHSPQSWLLRADVPQSLYYDARFWATPGPWTAWGALDAALTGKTPHEVAWNTGRVSDLREHPDEARLFDAFMAHFPDERHNAVATSYDFSGAKLIADIGGGNGETLRRILARFPAPRGLVFDLKDVVEAITPSECLDGRIAVQAGSFFDGVPAAADIYLLIRVLHNWSDEDCVRILRALRGAMPADARVLIVDHILEADPAIGHPTDYLLDMQMMAMFGSARARTEAEFGDLLGAAGLEASRVIRTPSPVSIIEALPK